MKKIPALGIALLLIFVGLSGCKENESSASEDVSISENDVVSTLETSVASEESPAITEEFSNTVSDTVSETEKTSETEIEYGEYFYSPPKEVLDTHFYCDDVEAEITLQNASKEDFNIFDIFNDPEVEKAMHKAWSENLPQEIVDDMIQNPQLPEFLKDLPSDNVKITSMGYMKYDFNSDGREDYYVFADIDEKDEVKAFMYMRTFYDFRRVYITEDSGFLTINIPDFSDTLNGIQSILSTKTNGVKDLLAFCNSNSPSLKYDGVSAYGGAVELDERHTFITAEILPDNLLRLKMVIYSTDAPDAEYYTAIKFADNPYMKNTLLYTCYPDGTPRAYKDVPDGFSPSIEGYEFYVELNENAAEIIDGDSLKSSAWEYLDLLEIKYIGVDEDDEYVYNPPQEVLDTHFYCDDIEAEIVCQSALDDDFEIGDIWNDPQAEKALYEALTKNLPAEIVDNVMQNYQSPYDSEKYSDIYKVDEIFYMKYDLDSDGEDDYYLNVSLKEGADFFMSEDHFERIFISDSGSFVPVEIPSLKSTRLSCMYFLSTKTNGLKDIFVYHNSNTPSMKYDGISAYGGAASFDEMHTFIRVDMLSDNILHLNMNMSVIDAPIGEYYTAIQFADNQYLKNNMLYTCYPEGTPRSYIEKPFGESLPTDFHASIDGYDFYVELDKDAMSTIDIDDFQNNIWNYLDLLEIKYVAVNENQE